MVEMLEMVETQEMQEKSSAFEILTPEWQYSPGPQGDFEYVLPVKERVRFGTRSRCMSTPQAPAIEVRLHKKFLANGNKQRHHFAKAELWCFGAAFEGEEEKTKKSPDCSGFPFTELAPNTAIGCSENIVELIDRHNDSYLYAKMSCIITRGARVYCRKNHVALRLSLLGTPKSEIEEGVALPWGRTARLSISEKAMRGPSCGDKRKVQPETLSRDVVKQMASPTKKAAIDIASHSLYMPDTVAPLNFFAAALQPHLLAQNHLFPRHAQGLSLAMLQHCIAHNRSVLSKNYAS